jgi:hypothetical protein
MYVRDKQACEFSHVCRNRSAGASPNGHWRGGMIGRVVVHTSTFLRPFAPRALPRFVAPMDALTPTGRLFDRPRPCGCSSMNSVLLPAGLSGSWAWPSDHSVPNHRFAFPLSPLCRVTTARQAAVSIPQEDLAGRWELRRTVWGSSLASRLPGRLGRIGFVILRTDRSPPVALHPALRRRSYTWIQVCNVNPEKTCTSLTKLTIQTH